MQVRTNQMLSIAVFLILFANFAYSAQACAGTIPPCNGPGVDKECNDPATEICTEDSSGTCGCIPAFCPAPGERTYLNVLYKNENNFAEGDLDIELYFIGKDTTGKGEKTPVEGGLIIINSGRYVTGSSTYAPFSINPLDNKVCKAFTDSDGEVKIKLEHPPGGMRITHGIIFCPYVESTAAGQKDLAICARLLDENGNLHETIEYGDIPNCDDSWSAGMSEEVVIGGISKKIWDGLAPAETSVSASNDGPSSAEVTFCWALAVVFGLLLSASFTAGKNPLMFFDLNAARSIRMNRAAGQYQPMNQMVSINVEAALNTAYSAVKTGITAFSDGQVKTDDEGNVIDENGNEITGEDGMPLKLDENGNVVNNSGERVATPKNAARMGIADRMNAAYAGSRGGIRGELTSLAGEGLEELGVGTDGSVWGNIAKDVASTGLVGLVEGAIAGFGGGGLGGAVKAVGKSAAVSGKQLLKTGIVEGIDAIAPEEDTSDTAPDGGAAANPLQAAGELKNELVNMLGLSDEQANNLEIQKINNPGGGSYYRVKGKEGTDVANVKAYFGSNGEVKLRDAGGVSWTADAFIGENGGLVLTDKTRDPVQFGGSGGGGAGYQIINGVLMKTGGSGFNAFFEHIATIGATIYEATFGEGKWMDVLNTAIPYKALINTFTKPFGLVLDDTHTFRDVKMQRYRVSNSTRGFRIGNDNYTIRGNEVRSGNGAVGTFADGKIELNGHKYRLDGNKVLDVTNEDDKNPRIMPDVKSNNVFSLNGEDFSAQAPEKENHGKGTVQNIVRNGDNSSEVNVAKIYRDENGNISRITDNAGNEINSLTVDGVEFSLHVGAPAASSGGRGAEPLYISTVGEVSNSSSEGWKSLITDLAGKPIIDANGTPVESMQQAYMVAFRKKYGVFSGGQTKATTDAQERIREHLEVQNRLAAGAGISPQDMQTESKLMENEIKVKSKIPDAEDKETDEILGGDYAESADNRNAASKLARIEGLKYIANRQELSDEYAQIENNPLIKKAGKGMNTIFEYGNESREDAMGVQLKIAKKYEAVAEKIAKGEDVTSDMAELSELKKEHDGYIGDLNTYETARVATQESVEASLKFNGLKKEFNKLNKNLINSVNEYEDGDDKVEHHGKIKYVRKIAGKLKNCNTVEEAQTLLNEANEKLASWGK